MGTVNNMLNMASKSTNASNTRTKLASSALVTILVSLGTISGASGYDLKQVRERCRYSWSSADAIKPLAKRHGLCAPPCKS